MKGGLFKLLVFLLLGAATTVVVAWGCALWSQAQSLGRHKDHEPRLTERVEQLWQDLRPSQEVHEPVWCMPLIGPGVSDVIVMCTEQRVNDGRLQRWPMRMVVREAGWPMRSMQGVAWHVPSYRLGSIEYFRRLSSIPPDHHARSIVVSALRLPLVTATDEDEIRLIPLHPIWPGFAVNSAVYAGAWWGLLALVVMARRRRLVLRGRCPSCARDLRGDFTGQCPDCGLSLAACRIANGGKHPWRMLIKSFAFLALGAVLSVAIAGACFHYRDPVLVQGWALLDLGSVFAQAESFGLTETIEYGRLADAEEVLPPLPTEDIVFDIVGYSFTPLGDRWTKRTQASWLYRRKWGIKAEISVGWPYRCITGAQRWGAQGPRQLIDAIDLRSVGSSVIVPVGPTRGFVFNTIFYAAILWLIFAAPSMVRRTLRRHRGRCARCGYDLRGAEHEVCPECGVGRLPASNKAGERRAGE